MSAFRAQHRLPSLFIMTPSGFVPHPLRVLQASLWSLDFTGAWLETAHGPTILAISLLMAGGGAAAGQLLAGQPAGIGGIGARACDPCATMVLANAFVSTEGSLR